MSTRALNPKRTFPFRLFLGSLGTALLVIALFAISLPINPVAAPSETFLAGEANLMMSGAFFANPADSDITLSCSKTGILMTLGFNGSYSTLVKLTTPGPNGVHSFGNTASALELSLVDAAGESYQTFRASEGSLELYQNSGHFSAVLWNENSEQLFLSGRWSC